MAELSGFAAAKQILLKHFDQAAFGHLGTRGKSKGWAGIVAEVASTESMSQKLSKNAKRKEETHVFTKRRGNMVLWG